MKSLYFLILIVLLAVSLDAAKIKHRSHNKLRNKNKLRFKQEEVPAVVHEGWLRISSDNLIDNERYPAIPAKREGKPATPVQIFGSGHTDELQKVDGANYDGNFRKNSQWHEDGSGVPPAIDAFYFRLSGHNLYYTETDTDMVVLGAIAIHNIVATAGGDASCFSVVDDENDGWTLCTFDEAPTSDWICPISEVLGLPCPEEQEVVHEKIIHQIQPMLIVPLPSPDCARDWNYNYHGANWVCRCNEGLEQSPIDLPDPNCLPLIKVNADFDYRLVKKGDVEIVYHTNILRILPKNSKINMGKLTDIDGTEYQVSEVLIHTPAEHTIKMRKYDAELQVIHRAIKGEFKQKAVVSIIYERRPGTIVQGFEEMDILNLPNPLFREGHNLLSKDFHIMKFMYNDDVYNSPPPFNYYKYRGSFTFPPCEEDVIWFVKADPVYIGSTTWTFLRDVPNPPKVKGDKDCKTTAPGVVTYADNYDGTNREIQPIRSRELYFFDRTQSCNPYFEKPKPPRGHYEKIEKKGTKYFFVDSDKPSGIPGALVISKEEAEGKPPGGRGSTDRYDVHA